MWDSELSFDPSLFCLFYKSWREPWGCKQSRCTHIGERERDECPCMGCRWESWQERWILVECQARAKDVLTPQTRELLGHSLHARVAAGLLRFFWARPYTATKRVLWDSFPRWKSLDVKGGKKKKLSFFFFFFFFFVRCTGSFHSLSLCHYYDSLFSEEEEEGRRRQPQRGRFPFWKERE